MYRGFMINSAAPSLFHFIMTINVVYFGKDTAGRCLCVSAIVTFFLASDPVTFIIVIEIWAEHAHEIQDGFYLCHLLYPLE